MTIQQLRTLHSALGQKVLKDTSAFIAARRHGVVTDQWICNRDKLRLFFMRRLLAGHEGDADTESVVLPAWLSAQDFDAFTSSLLKRLK